jgi:uncharacterized membrane protein
MILHVATASPWWIKDAATAALVLHIGGGATGLITGAVALAARKGGKLHRIAGDVFVVAMVTMGCVAAVVAPMIHQPNNSVGGAFTAYLVLTGWATMRRPAGSVGRLESLAAILPAAGAVLLTGMGTMTAISPHGMLMDAFPSFIAGAMAAFAAACDVSMIRRGGLSGTQRLTRHLWRMCVGLFVASGSFFLGQQQVLPAMIQGSQLLFIPAFAPLAIMVFWLVRVRRPGGPAAGLRPQAV